MKVLITDDGGFPGSPPVGKLIEQGCFSGPSGKPEPIIEITLFDTHFTGNAQKLTIQQGSVIDNTLLNGDRGKRCALSA